MSPLRHRLRAAAWLLAGLLLAGAAAGGAVLYFAVLPALPPVERLKEVHFQVPLRIYTRDGRLIAEYGDKKRTPVKIEDVPPLMVKAVLAAEDDRFYRHPGVDWQGILRAAWHLLLTGRKTQGGSTITMQVARNFFLSSEKTYLRKLREIVLALRIERELSKDEILELYLNKIYLGQRAYGVAAAAQVYYGKPLKELTLAQMAMIAGLPKAPSRDNPIASPERARARRDYVLRRMRELGYIGEAAYRRALAAPITARSHRLRPEVEAAYAAELVRAQLLARYGERAYTMGLAVRTTLDGRLQQAAVAALRGALEAYDRRHGYRGPEARVSLPPGAGPEAWRRALAGRAVLGGLRPAVVVAVGERAAAAYIKDPALPEGGRLGLLPWEGLSWARPYRDENHRGPAPRSAGEVVAVGDVVRVRPRPDGAWDLAQLPQVEGALVALRPEDGSVAALAGGFDFRRSKFNRAVQAARQPGSAFKPFVYSAALEHGFTAATVVNDAPVVFDDPALERAWRPENYSGRFFGPTRLREALVHSRNLVSIRVLQAVGLEPTLRHLARFGFDPGRLPHDLSLALGSASLSPLELAAGYAVFANGGFRVTPYLIQEVRGPGGEVLMRARPAVACQACAELPEGAHPAPRAISPQNAYLMTSMMRDVIRRGTGRRARALGRHDLAGKTGTTNEQRDAWFAGFQRRLVAVSWVGFDDSRPLGRRETGARAALPMWMAFMGEALRGVPEAPFVRPPGLVTVRIDPATGLLAAPGSRAVFETFRAGRVPRRH
ncbi:MAG: penicillin-binding protein 1A, partial [Gammaproteobacteria bacterium]